MIQESDEELVNRVILDLSLVSSLPVGPVGRDLIKATAAATSLANVTKTMDRKDLRSFEWTLEPLLKLLLVDIEHPVASKVALALRMLMNSRICMTCLLNTKGLEDIAKVLDILLNKHSDEMKTLSQIRYTVENLAICYREIARFYPWPIVDVGGLRHCVAILRFGDVALQTIA
jgi:hypothetical protein